MSLALLAFRGFKLSSLLPFCLIVTPRRWQLLQRYRKRETYIEVDLGHVNEFRPQLLDMLTLKPTEYLPLFEEVSAILARRNRCSSCQLMFDSFHLVHDAGVSLKPSRQLY